MTTKGIGQQSFPATLNAERRQQELIVAKQAKGAKHVKAVNKDAIDAHHVPAKLIERLGVAGVPEKVAEKHGDALKAAAGDAAAISAFAKTKLEPWRARSFQRIVEQFYKALGSALDLAPADARSAIAKDAVASLRGLITAVGTADSLGSSVSSAVALFELGMREAGRGALQLTPRALSSAMEEASTAIKRVSARLAGRTGLSTALNIFPVLAEQLEQKHEQLDPALRQKLWGKVEGFLADAAPLHGIDQAGAAELTKALSIALEKHPAELDAALKEATQLFRKPHLRAHRDALKQIDERRVPGLPLKSPGRPAFDALNEALLKTAQAHPGGPNEVTRAIIELRTAAAQALAGMNPARLDPDPWPAITQLVERFGATPHAKPLLSWLKDTVAHVDEESVARAFTNALEADKPSVLARRLADVALARNGYGPDDDQAIRAQLDKIGKLAPDAALSCALALQSVIGDVDEQTAALAERMIKLAGEGGKDDLHSFLAQTAERMNEVIGNFGYHHFGGEDETRTKVGVAAAIARASAGIKDLEEPVDKVSTLLSTVHNELDRVNLEAIVASEGADRPGLWTLSDPAIRYRHDVDEVLTRVMSALARTPIARSNAEVQTEATRFALRLTEVIAKLDGDYEIPLSRIEQDVVKAFNRPGALEFAFRGKKAAELRRNEKPGVSEYLNAHPEYPLELALTAGVHLSAEQGAWLIDRLDKAVARDTKRQLRDFVFACISANKKPLIEALRTTKAPSKAVARTIAYVARNYRDDKLDEIRWAPLIRGFNAGEDPIGKVEQERIAKTLDELGLGKIAKGELNEEGLAMIAKCGEPITYLLEYFVKGHNEDGIDHLRFRKPLLDVLESVARGTWPSVKYENGPGKRQMGALTEEQQQVWREETVVAAHDQPKGDNTELRRALKLAGGLDRALRRDAKLDAPGAGELGWNKDSLKRLQERYAQLIDVLRGTEKGTRAHIERGLEIKAVRDALVILELHYAIQNAGADPKKALLALRQPLEAAMSAIKRQGLDGALQAATEIGFVAADIKSSPRQGTYAVDEDNLESLLTSTTGGCIHYTEIRRWANCSLAANANEKIIRVYDGDNFVYRAIMRFHEAEIGKYKGPVLWINEANANGNGEEEHKELLLRHALAKARAMGIPLVSNQEDLHDLARSAKTKCEHREIKLKIDGGNTDAIFTDYCISSDVKAERGDKALWETEVDCYVIMPK